MAMTTRVSKVPTQCVSVVWTYHTDLLFFANSFLFSVTLPMSSQLFQDDKEALPMRISVRLQQYWGLNGDIFTTRSYSMRSDIVVGPLEVYNWTITGIFICDKMSFFILA